MKVRPFGAMLVGLIVLACSAAGGAPSAPSSSVPSAAGPSESSTAPASAPAADLTIFGAASLAGVLDAATTAYETANPGSTLTVSTDSSAALEMQIEQGAPADVFLAADTTNPQKLVDGGSPQATPSTSPGMSSPSSCRRTTPARLRHPPTSRAAT